jgi:hypothetical protein
MSAKDGRFCIRSKTGMSKSPTLLPLTSTAIVVATNNEIKYAITSLNKESPRALRSVPKELPEARTILVITQRIMKTNKNVVVR